MNKYLPRKDELEPITDPWDTFYKCGFNKPFYELDFKTQLQIAVDLVRQSMLPKSNPDPKTEIEMLTGDCHTAALGLIDYLKYLGIGKNHKYVLCRQKPYEPDDIGTRHAAVLVEDENGDVYFADATPFVGYMFGNVKKCDKNSMPYKEIVEIGGEKLELLEKMRMFLYMFSRNEITTLEQAKPYIIDIMHSKKYSILNSYTSRCIYRLSSLTNDKEKKIEYENLAKELDPYKYAESKIKNKIRIDMVNKAILKWKSDLKVLRMVNPGDLREELKLARWIYQELKLKDSSLETFVNLGQPSNRLSNLTPRLFLEEGINVIILKPSAFFVGVQDKIREAMIGDSEVISKYECNLGEQRNLTKISPMNFAHPFGSAFQRAMFGRSEIIAVRKNALDLKSTKKKLRKQYSPLYDKQKVIWNDGDEIDWDSNLLNLVHSTDDPIEACLHMAIARPEQQLVTIFTYPNPVFKYIDNKLCCESSLNIKYGEERIKEINKILDVKRREKKLEEYEEDFKE